MRTARLSRLIAAARARNRVQGANPVKRWQLFERDVIVVFAQRNRLPAMYAFKDDVAAGGLVAYGVDVIDLFRRVVGYVDKILRGANPGELPVEQPTRLQFILNPKTAGSLLLTVPPLMLARADEVLE